ncbi:hypothetical protein RCG23_05710 [Neobacillus sp. PS3-34]|uniref:hypothetical protein n=1 Tax=Neobacillus sp. PS3-34 TaxID=3070678 RepID=UPI0027DEBC7D|nr:hypothetical protein [Neobacillus sp. PS3-34]WML49495.1 hypothetical protein RCG23_05710 [Neobacillus sp. PS3-34]
MFIINLNYIKPLEEIDKLRDEHVQFLKKYYADWPFSMSGVKHQEREELSLRGGQQKLS